MELKIGDINVIYFNALKGQLGNNHERLRIGENAFPTAIAPKNLLRELPWQDFSELLKNQKALSERAASAAVWIKKAQGGGGTSILRQTYLERILNKKNFRVGAKGTDLFTRNLVSLAEVQLLQSLRDLREKKFREIFFQDLVGIDSEEALKKLWSSPSKINPQMTYENLTKHIEGFRHYPATLQNALPTLDENGNFTHARVAPGGHGFFAFECLLSAVHAEPVLKPKGQTPLVATLGNGEDLGSSPNPLVIGWMIDKKIPIAMITTEKTEIDLKGGQIAIVKPKTGAVYIALIEQAQAKQEGQFELFEKIGLEIRERNQLSFFNTNTALFNFDILVPKLKELLNKIGEDEFINAITPTLIQNKKSQRDSKGAYHTYIQLEGAMGSTLLNLDRVWRSEFSEPLVHILNVDRSRRTQFFSPIKTAFDFFMLFHSDRFSFDEKDNRLNDHKPGELPSVHLPHDFYQDVENIFSAFQNSEIRELTELHVEGHPVTFRNTKLEGKVKVHNHSGEIFHWKDKILSHSEVEITPTKEIKIKRF